MKQKNYKRKTNEKKTTRRGKNDSAHKHCKSKYQKQTL